MTQPSDEAIAREHDLGGDPACWLHRVCDVCGRFIDDEFARVCPACGAQRESARADRPSPSVARHQRLPRSPRPGP